MKLNNLSGYTISLCITTTDEELSEAMSNFYKKNIWVQIEDGASPWTEPKIFIDHEKFEYENNMPPYYGKNAKLIADCLGIEHHDRLSFFGYYDDSFQTILILYDDPAFDSHNNEVIAENATSFFNDIESFMDSKNKQP